MTAPLPLATRDMFGLATIDASGNAVMDAISQHLANKQFLNIAFLNANNANIAMRDSAYRKAVSQSMILPDGIGVDIGARLLYGHAFTENLNGTDFVPSLLRAMPKGTRIAMVGAKPTIAEKAAAKLAALNGGLDFVFVSDGYQDGDKTQATLAALARAKPDILLVAMGTPVQEKWVSDHINKAHCTCVITVGALFDFLAGEVARAPVWVRNLRAEWVFRLAQEPGRLWKRYIIGNGIYLARVLALKFSPHSRPNHP